MQEEFPGGQIPSVATIARHLASVGQVDVSPRKRPRSSYIRFVRANPMSLWQLDAFEYKLTDGTVVTIYQMLDDASRFDVGTQVHTWHENSMDAEKVLKDAIRQYGAPKELLSDNSSPVQSTTPREGRHSRGLPRLERNHADQRIPGPPHDAGQDRTLPSDVDALPGCQPARHLGAGQEKGRSVSGALQHSPPTQSLGQATPAEAWEVLERTPATEPIPLVVLEAKAKAYLNRRRISASNLYRAHLMIMKDRTMAPSQFGEDARDRDVDEAIVTLTKENHQLYYKGLQIKLPAHYGGREYYRTISDDEFVVADPRTEEVVFSFPLPLVALRVNGSFVSSFSIRVVYLSHPTQYWLRKVEEF